MSNPYAAPVAKPSGGLPPNGSTNGIWRDGDLMVVHKNATLPDRCVKTNEVAVKRVSRKFYWHSRLLYLLILLHILIYAVVALMVRKKHQIDVPISEVTASKRTKGICIGWAVGLFGFAMIVGGITFAITSQRGDSLLGVYVGLFFVGFIVMLIGVIVGSRTANILVPKKMNDHATWFKGASPDFVRTLPEIPPMAQ